MPDQDALRRLPAVGVLLASAEVAPLVARHGRELVAEAVRRAVGAARDAVMAGREPPAVGAHEVERIAEGLAQPSLRRVINATGVVLHTNLGRAALAREAQLAVAEVARGYSNTELDLESGERGSRHAHVSSHLAALLDAEDAIAVNNCAGAVLVMLAAIARGRQVIVARGELVEIGGGFRVPDVMRESGAELVEVGTTNKVYARDYERAITDRTAAILNVHRSNFALVGFTAEPGVEALSEVAKRRGLPLLVDVGSGLLADPRDLGPAAAVTQEEPRPKDLLARGADLVCFSGDKLLGGPQAGIVAGKKALVARVREHPLVRALRVDKLTLAALEATLRLYRDGRAQEIPTLRALSMSREEIAARAERIAREIHAASPSLAVSIRDGESVVGGGSLPLGRLPTRLVLIGDEGALARRLAVALRRGTPPVIGRMVDDRIALDPRALSDEDVAVIARIVVEVSSGILGDVLEKQHGSALESEASSE